MSSVGSRELVSRWLIITRRNRRSCCRWGYTVGFKSLDWKKVMSSIHEEIHMDEIEHLGWNSGEKHTHTHYSLGVLRVRISESNSSNFRTKRFPP